MKQKSAGDTVH